MDRVWNSDKKFLSLLLVLFLFWCLLVIGAVRAFSPVPFWDMWSGYLDFFVRVRSGNVSVWWEQHNEHRILLSKILFWIDLEVFKGSIWFLILCNYVLLGAICYVFWKTASRLFPLEFRFCALLPVIWVSSWCQNENLVWGFQSQFLLAQLLPFMSFIALNSANGDKGKHKKFFVLSLIFGVLSLGTMANGVIVLPLLAGLAIHYRFRITKISILCLLSMAAILLYFLDYTSPAQHSSVSKSLIEQPKQFIEYILLYFGGPAHHILGASVGSVFVPRLCGAFFLSLFSVFFWLVFFRRRFSSIEASLLFFILYACISAAATAGGRLFLGTEQSFSSRYATPVLMSWSALFIVAFSRIVSSLKINNLLIFALAFGSTLLFLPSQMLTLAKSDANLIERKIAALAIEIGARDKSQLRLIYPDDSVLELAKIPIRDNLSFFGNGLVRDVREKIGHPLSTDLTLRGSCLGNIDAVIDISDERYLRVQGWFFTRTFNGASKVLWILDERDTAVGYALIGVYRPDVATAVNIAALYSGFKGYLLNAANGQNLKLYDPDSKCARNARK